jgi:FKBP-type peptidyl-prolyl cis-trans isomerase 2
MNNTKTLLLAAALILLTIVSAVPAFADENPTAGKEKIVIETGRTVSIEYTLTLDDGTVADSNVGGDPLKYSQGSGQILPALEQKLEGMVADETLNVRLSVAEGYGDVNPDFFREVPEDSVPEDARVVGQVLYGEGSDGKPFQVRVHEVKDESVVLDLNHPLAGQALNFEVRVVSVE